MAIIIYIMTAPTYFNYQVCIYANLMIKKIVFLKNKILNRYMKT